MAFALFIFHCEWQNILVAGVMNPPTADPSTECCTYGPWAYLNNSCICDNNEKRGGLYTSLLQSSTCPNIPCATALYERVCDTDVDARKPCCYQDCLLGDWSMWSTCQAPCGSTGVRKKTRPILSEPACGGSSCSNMEQQEECRSDCCPVDCILDKWSVWSGCSNQCGYGKRKQVRNVLQSPTCGGRNCFGLLLREESCLKYSNVNCSVSPWNAWGECKPSSGSCGPGMKTRTRDVLVEPLCLGQVCPMLEDIAPCDGSCCPVDCLLSQWSQWTFCSASCGGGSRSRYRRILTQGNCGGKLCSASDKTVEVSSCLIQEKLNCTLKEWSQWSLCAKGCGNGERIRQRTLQTSSSCQQEICHTQGDVLKEVEKCDNSDPSLDCELGTWSVWSLCIRSREVGVRFRNRILLKPSSCSRDCPALQEMENCQAEACEQESLHGVCVCYPGFVLNSGNNNSCTLVQCKPLPEYILYEPAMDKRYGQPFRYAKLKYRPETGKLTAGVKAVPVCEDDFELAGDTTAFVCQADGSWSRVYSQVYCRVKNRPPKDIFLTSSKVKENMPRNFCFAQVTSTSVNLDEANDTYVYEIVKDFEQRLKLLNNATNNSTWLCLNHIPDYEAPQNEYEVTIRSMDQGGLFFDKVFPIQIENENEGPRLCQNGLQLLKLPENPIPGEVLANLSICDEDSLFSDIEVVLLDNNGGEFEIVPLEDATNSSLIYLLKASSKLPLVCGQGGGPECPLNHEGGRGNEIVLLLSDHGVPPQSQMVILDVILDNKNDKPSSVTIHGLKRISVIESREEKTYVGKLEIEDEDVGSEYQVSLTNDSQVHFLLEKGVLYFRHAVNYESHSNNNLYVVDIQVVDEGTPTWTITEHLEVLVINENEPPSIASVLDHDDDISLSFPVFEDSPIGTVLATLMLCDPDENDTISLKQSSDTWFNTNIIQCEYDPGNDGNCNTMCFVQLVTAKQLDFSSGKKYVGEVTPVDGLKHQGSSLNFTLTKEERNNASYVVYINNGPILNVYSIPENSNSFIIGKLTLSSSDNKPSPSSMTFSLISDETGKFEITADNILQLQTNQQLDFESARKNNNNKTTYMLSIMTLDYGSPVDSIELVNITVHIQDVNEPPLKIQLSSLQIDESTHVGEVVATISCFDPDEGQSCILFQLLSQSINDVLLIKNGNQLVLDKPVDYEAVKRIWITIIGYDNGAPAESLEQSFSITVGDSNDAPQFLSSDAFIVFEKVPIGHIIGYVLARDEDVGQMLNYTLNTISQGIPLPFSLHTPDQSYPLVGVPLVVSGILNYETNPDYDLVITVQDNASPSMSAIQKIKITVTNENEAPKSDFLLVQFQLNEQLVLATGNPVQFPSIHIYDDDMRDLLTLSLDGDTMYSQVGTDSLQFQLTPSECGDMSSDSLVSPDCLVNITLVSGLVNYERSDTLRYVLTVRDSANTALAVRIKIEVLDVNDAPNGIQLKLPQSGFTVPFNQVFVKENLKMQYLGKLLVLDEDVKQNHTVHFIDDEGRSTTLLVVQDDMNLWMTSDAGLDYETRNQYTLMAVVTDSGNPPLSYRQNVTLFVENVNEAPTDVRMTNDKVNESAPINTLIGRFIAVDSDFNDTLTFTLVDDCRGRFKLYNNMDLVVAESTFLDYEKQDRFSIVVVVRDSGFPTITRNGSFIIRLGDVNEPPTGIHLSGQFLGLDALPLTIIGNLTAIDPDKNETLKFSLPKSPFSPCFMIQSNQLVRSTQSSSCPMKLNDIISLPITVTDKEGQFLTESFHIYVTDGVEILAQWFSDSIEEIHFPANHPVVKENSGIQKIGYLWVYAVNGGPFTITSISMADPNSPLTIDTSSLNIEQAMHHFNIKLTRSLDYEVAPHLIVEFILNIKGSTVPRHISFILEVEGVNEKPTGIDTSPRNDLRIVENAKDDIIFGRFLLRDPDFEDTLWDDSNTTVHFTILTGTEWFYVNSAGYIAVNTNADLDYERKSFIDIVVQGTDSAGNTINKEFIVSVDDVNETPTGINTTSFSVEEQALGDTLVGHLVALDPDNTEINVKQNHTFVILEGSGDRFYVDKENNLRVLRDDTACRKYGRHCYIDFEETSSFNLMIRVVDNGEPHLSADIIVNIPVIDVDEPPTSMHLEFHPHPDSTIKVPLTNLREDTPVGTMVGAVYVMDKDLNNTYDCFISPGASTYVKMEPPLNEVNLNVPLDFEKASKITIKVRCHVVSKKSQWITQDFQVYVTDVNEPPRSISTSSLQDNVATLHVSENIIEGSVIGTLYLSDEDLNEDLSILCASIMGDGWSSGSVVYCTPPKCVNLGLAGMTKCQSNVTCQNSTAFNYEVRQRFSMEVNVTDKVGNRLSRQITVIIDDVDDPPSAIQCDSIMLHLPSDESSLQINEHSKNVMLCDLSVVDEDDHKPFQFYLEQVGRFLSLEIRAGTQLWLTDQNELDFEKLGQISISLRQKGLSFTLLGNSSDGESIQTNVVLNVLDQEELLTRLVLTNPKVSECVKSGSRISEIIGDRDDRQHLPYQYKYTLKSHTDLFYIVDDSLFLQQGRKLDYEKVSKYMLSISVAFDVQPASVSQLFTIPLVIMNCNEPPYNLSLTLVNQGVKENQHGLYFVGTLSAHDDDPGQTLQFTIYNSVNIESQTSPAPLWFILNKYQLYLATSLNYETQKTLSFTIQVSDSAVPAMTATQSFIIAVKNANDQPDFHWYTSDPNSSIDSLDGRHIIVVRNETVEDPSANGSEKLLLAKLYIEDEDVDDQITVQLADQLQLFQITKWSKETRYVNVYLVGPIDYESQKRFDLTLLIQDNSSTQQKAFFTLVVANVNEAPSNITLLTSGKSQGNVLSVPQNIPSGTVIGRIVARDPDHDMLNYRLNECFSCADLLDINSFTGDIYVAKTFSDFQLGQEAWLSVIAVDSNGAQSSPLNIIMEVTDRNDVPIIRGVTFTQVPQYLESNSALGNILVEDRDTTDVQDCSLTIDNVAMLVDTANNQLVKTRSQLLFMKSQVTVIVQCSDNGQPSLSATPLIFILPVSLPSSSLNDTFQLLFRENNGTGSDDANTSSFSYTNIVYVNENAGDIRLGYLEVTPPTKDAKRWIAYSVDREQFQVKDGGELRLLTPLDYESGEAISLNITASFLDPHSGDTLRIFTILMVHVVNVNEHPDAFYLIPMNDFPLEQQEDGFKILVVQEHTPAGILLAQWNVHDPDNVGTALSPQNHTLHDLTISSSNGELVVPMLNGLSVSVLAVETGQSSNADYWIFSHMGLPTLSPGLYNVQAILSDDGTPSLSLNVTFLLRVDNVNDPPTDILLNLESFALNETLSPGLKIGNLTVVDPDAGDSHHCTLLSSYWTLNDETKELFISEPFDYESFLIYNFEVECSDTVGLRISRSWNLPIQDVNEPPVNLGISNDKWLEQDVTDVLIAVATITGIDPERQPLRYGIWNCDDGSLPCPVILNSSSSGLLLVNDSLIKWPNDQFALSFFVSDGEWTVNSTVRVQIIRDPLFTASVIVKRVNITENSPAGTVAATLQYLPTNDVNIQCSISLGSDTFVLKDHSIVTREGAKLDFETDSVKALELLCNFQDTMIYKRRHSIYLVDENESLLNIQFVPFINNTKNGHMLISESFPLNVTFGLIQVVEEDRNIGHIICEQVDNDGSITVNVSPTTILLSDADKPCHLWAVSLKESLNFESNSVVNMRVSCKDEVSEFKKTWTFAVAENNEPPQGINTDNLKRVINLDSWTSDTLSMFVGDLVVIDPDEGQVHDIVILDGAKYFTINESRSLHVQNLQFAWPGEMSLKLSVTDNGIPRLETNISISFQFVQTSGFVNISSNVIETNTPAGFTIGILSYHTSLQDILGRSDLTFSLVQNPSELFAIKESAYLVLVGSGSRLQFKSYDLSVSAAREDGYVITTSHIRITVSDRSPCMNPVCPLNTQCETVYGNIITFRCTCRPNYIPQSGDRATNVTHNCLIDPSIPCERLNNPCLNNATCVYKEPTRVFQCICSKEYYGDQCESKATCNDTNCDHGYCVLDNERFPRCECFTGYSGDHCEVIVDECITWGATCENGGICLDRNNSFVCECPPNAAGEICQFDSSSCNLESRDKMQCTADDDVCIPALMRNNTRLTEPRCLLASKNAAHVSIPVPDYVKNLSDLKSVFNYFTAQYIHYKSTLKNTTPASVGRKRRAATPETTNGSLVLINNTIVNGQASFYFVVLMPDNSVPSPSSIVGGMQGFCENLLSKGQNETLFCPAFKQLMILSNGTIVIRPMENNNSYSTTVIIILAAGLVACTLICLIGLAILIGFIAKQTELLISSRKSQCCEKS